MPFDPTKKAKRPDFERDGIEPRATVDEVYAARMNEMMYQTMDEMNSPEARDIERQIIAEEKTVQRGTAGWDAFIKKWGLDDPRYKKPNRSWKLSRQDAARKMADSRGLPIYNVAETAYRTKMRQPLRYQYGERNE